MYSIIKLSDYNPNDEMGTLHSKQVKVRKFTNREAYDLQNHYTKQKKITSQNIVMILNKNIHIKEKY